MFEDLEWKLPHKNPMYYKHDWFKKLTWQNLWWVLWPRYEKIEWSKRRLVDKKQISEKYDHLSEGSSVIISLNDRVIEWKLDQNPSRTGLRVNWVTYSHTEILSVECLDED